jgi:hypothetical protein
MCIYNLSDYHYLFIPIAFVLAYWIFEESGTKPKNKDIIKGFNIWLVFCLIIYLPIYKSGTEILPASWYRISYFSPWDIQKQRMKCVYDTIPEGSVLYIKMFLPKYDIPNLKYKYILKDIYGKDLLSFDNFFELYHSSYRDYNGDFESLRAMDREYKHHYLYMDTVFVYSSHINNFFTHDVSRCMDLFIYKID